MKNRLKVIILWIVVALLIQFSGLFYANNYLFGNNVQNVEMEKVESNQDAKDKPLADIKVPKDLNMFKISYKGKYISYVENQEIKIINTQTGAEKKTSFSEGSYYQWIDGRNRMLIGLKKGSNIELSYYDVDKEQKEKIKDIQITESGKLEDIKFSTLTQVTYLRVQSVSKTTVFRSNIMNELSKVSTRTAKIGNIFAVKREDKLIYEDSTSSNIYITDSDSMLKAGEGKNKILGTDLEDNVYIANINDDGTIKKMMYGSIKNISSLQTINVPQGTNYKNIHITDKGNVYLNENLKGILKDLKNNKEISYKGKLLSISENIIASDSENKLVITKIEH